MADKVSIYLRGSPGIRGVYYGPGLVEVPRDVAETIAQNAGKSVDQLVEEAAPYREQAEREAAEASAAQAATPLDQGRNAIHRPRELTVDLPDGFGTLTTEVEVGEPEEVEGGEGDAGPDAGNSEGVEPGPGGEPEERQATDAAATSPTAAKSGAGKTARATTNGSKGTALKGGSKGNG